MKRFLVALAVVAAVAAGLYASALYGFVPVLNFIDEHGWATALKLDAGIVSSEISEAEDASQVGGLSYSFLTEEESRVYVGLYHAATERLQEFTLLIGDLNAIEPALTALLEDHPEIFWLTGSCSYSRPYGSKRCTLELEYAIEPAEIDSVQAQIDEQVSTYLGWITDETSDYNKAKWAYEYIIRTTDYGFDSPQNQNIMSVFIDHVSVCAGYARAYQYLLDQVGLPCSFIRGEIAGSSEDHAWNLVTIEGVDTYVDTTWGDPTYTCPRGEQVDGSITFDYLCLTTEEMERDKHVATQAAQLPVCADQSWDYYRLNGCYFETYDFTAVDDALRWCIGQGYTSVAFKFGSDEAYAAAVYDLQDRAFLRGAFQDLALSRGQVMSQHQYTTSDALRIVRFFWE